MDRMIALIDSRCQPMLSTLQVRADRITLMGYPILRVPQPGNAVPPGLRIVFFTRQLCGITLPALFSGHGDKLPAGNTVKSKATLKDGHS